MVRNFSEEGMASKILLIIADKENVGILFSPVKMAKLDTFSITSYTLSHLFQSLFFIHITLRIFSLCKSLKATHINVQSQTQI